MIYNDKCKTMVFFIEPQTSIRSRTDFFCSYILYAYKLCIIVMQFIFSATWNMVISWRASMQCIRYGFTRGYHNRDEVNLLTIIIID